MSNQIKLKKGEGKTITFTIKDSDGDVVDVSSATFTFGVKDDIDDSDYVIEKENANFDTTQSASGIISVVISSTDTDINPDIYVAELKIDFGSGIVDKSKNIAFEIEKTVIS